MKIIAVEEHFTVKDINDIYTKVLPGDNEMQRAYSKRNTKLVSDGILTDFGERRLATMDRSGIKVQLDVHNKPSIELLDKVNGKCYVLCIFNSDNVFGKVSVGDWVVCRGNYLVASSLFGLVLINNEVIEVKR